MKIRLVLVALAAMLVGGLGANAAQAAMPAPLVAHDAAGPSVTEVYWVWHHHHRMWVPNHRHY